MPPRLNLFAASTALRQSSTSVSRRTLATRLTQNSKLTLQSSTGIQRRWNSSDADERKKLEEAQRSAESMPHVSEEAAEINKIMGKDKEKRCDGTPSSPELEQGTPVSEILSRDKEARKHAPKVFQNQIKKGPASSRSFSTSARRGQLEGQNQGQTPGDADAQASAELVASMISQATQHGAGLSQTQETHNPNLKFPAPETLPKSEHYRTRYEPVVDQFTKLIMRDGKLALAQKNMSFILDYLRSSPPPQIAPRRPLLPGPPPPQLPLNPILYLTLIIDSVSPLIKIKQVKGIAGGGAALQVPYPLHERQRRRAAIKWLIDGSDKRKDGQFAVRVANELVAVAEGRSGIWEKREALHKLGIAGRVNLGAKRMSRKKLF